MAKCDLLSKLDSCKQDDDAEKTSVGGGLQFGGHSNDDAAKEIAHQIQQQFAFCDS